MSVAFAGGIGSGEFNQGDGVLQAGWMVQLSEFGATEATNTFALRRSGDAEENINEKADNLAVSLIGEKHHYANWLICEKASVSHQVGVSYVTCNYKGVYKDVEATKCSIEMSVTEEPIDTHPKFAEFAGKPSEMDDNVKYVPDTGAVFSGKNDLIDTFQEFVTTGNDNNGRQTDSLVGIEQWVKPEIVFVEQRTLGDGLTQSATQNLIDNLGERFGSVPDRMTSPSGRTKDIPEFVPSDYKEADWLLISSDYVPSGEGGILTRKWRLSGMYGWNEIVYEKGKDAVGAAQRNPQAYGQGTKAVEDLNDERILMAGDFQNTNAPPKDSSFEIDEEKHVNASYTYIVKAGDGMQLGKDWIIANNYHPYDYLSAKQVTITGLEGGVEQVDIRFEGVKEDGDWKPSMSVNTIIEPIDSHPNFHEASSGDPIGGTLDEPKNGANFNEAGAFQDFSTYVSEDEASQGWWKTKIDNGLIIDGHMPNAMAKTDSYVESGVEWTEVKYFSDVSESVRILKDMGYIKEPQSSDPTPPNVKSAVRGTGYRNWLLVDVKWEMVSTDFVSGYKVSATYKLSGNRGWNDKLYES